MSDKIDHLEAWDMFHRNMVIAKFYAMRGLHDEDKRRDAIAVLNEIKVTAGVLIEWLSNYERLPVEAEESTKRDGRL